MILSPALLLITYTHVSYASDSEADNTLSIDSDLESESVSKSKSRSKSTLSSTGQPRLNETRIAYPRKSTKSQSKAKTLSSNTLVFTNRF